MSEKIFKIVNGDISDGYHTFDELYEHRYLLFINLCLLQPEKASWTQEHYEGWDLLRLYLPSGQISYHIPKHFSYLYHNLIVNRDDEWDGHTSSVVVSRLARNAHAISFPEKNKEGE